MALHLSALYATDPLRKLSLCKRAAALQGSQHEWRRSMQLEHAASASASAAALMEKTARAHPAAAAAVAADCATASAEAAAEAPFAIGCLVQLARLNTQHLNGLVCRVTGLIDSGRVQVTPVDSPSAEHNSMPPRSFKVKPSNCILLRDSDKHERNYSQRSTDPASPPPSQPHNPRQHDELSPTHTVLKAFEIALFAHAIRVRPSACFGFIHCFVFTLFVFTGSDGRQAASVEMCRGAARRRY
jgi:hypothetical protein